MRKVLIVDDAQFMRVSLRKMLEENEFEVVGEASNGIEAIEKYMILKPEIVTMDITMPDMNGVDALKEIKKYDSNAKVIMISAIGQETWVKRAILEGAKGFIIKPFKKENVIKTISKL
ncbi:two-component system chemotaxis response regulator CheY [Clostridium tetanomorphum]|uniref:Stage 0 sporulation protein A homolog n=1 Tax=Clostridium tetanomorphum TaxID=1553 RepID=A0A923ECD8_CLOTT|nr:response regulator [Clostridium tetanomorphum]KAJ51028.1 hypothetical protein CTM_14893 [Clostridium tetanomorphum DSM 665]MBC2399337.1 response regulator [Clostridium tetanomorphum]MBP1865872.1 two-component system chemotaxis response regulator CheY [Clostridium tetanomorphum]NRS85321.1 two-component system chemotaxis response regulator CheY [Clostridium tetanomorphum]NRZ98500.1 two-component system chemotaxis response regulator CheY [Clostridium tetanomorphum]